MHHLYCCHGIAISQALLNDARGGRAVPGEKLYRPPWVFPNAASTTPRPGWSLVGLKKKPQQNPKKQSKPASTLSTWDPWCTHPFTSGSSLAPGSYWSGTSSEETRQLLALGSSECHRLRKVTTLPAGSSLFPHFNYSKTLFSAKKQQ